jgi:CRISPR-associated protein Cas2
MLYLVAYDIADPKRLHRIATICEDYGLRVQNSLFECWLEDEQFESLWTKLRETMVANVDRIAAYTLDKNGAKKRLVAGDTMKSTRPAYCYVA